MLGKIGRWALSIIFGISLMILVLMDIAAITYFRLLAQHEPVIALYIVVLLSLCTIVWGSKHILVDRAVDEAFEEGIDIPDNNNPLLRTNMDRILEMERRRDIGIPTRTFRPGRWGR